MKKIDIDFIKEYALENNCVLISTVYVKNTEPLIFKHLGCNRLFEKNLKEFKRYTSKCVHCNIDSRKNSIKPSSFKNIDEIQNKFNIISNGEFTAVDLSRDYINFKSKIELIHHSCGSRIFMTWNDFQQGHKCTKCKGISKRLSKAEIKSRVNNIKDIKYIDSEFKNNYHLVTTKHLACGKISEYRLNSILYAKNICKYCRSSRGERLVAQILEENNIDYDIEVKFSNCKNKLPLPFDFMIKYDNDAILIEFDGIQHFQVSFKDDLVFKRYQINDKIKNNFVIQENALLIRIKYTTAENTIRDFFRNLNMNVQRLVNDNVNIYYLT